MYGRTISLIFAVVFAVCCSHEVVYLDTPFYECKELCCTKNNCLSFDVVLSSLECYLNEESIPSADEIATNDRNANLNGRHNEVVKALHGSCRSWGKNSDGCLDGLRFGRIRKTKQENTVEHVTTSVGYAQNTMKSELVCPSSFILDADTASCWKIDSSRVVRLDAEKNCARLGSGGRLAVLDTPAKHLSVKKLLSKSSFKSCVHIGGRKMKLVGFMWLTEVEVGKQGWCPNEPSRGYNERLLSLYPEKGYCFDDMVIDYMCPYICEVHTLLKRS